MSLSAGQIGQVLAEIGDALQGGVIQKIDQPQPWSLVFEIHQRRERYHLYFSAQRRFSRIHLTHEKHPNPSSPPRFCQLLRAHLRWKQILSLEQIGEDRIVRMTCAWPSSRTGIKTETKPDVPGDAQQSSPAKEGEARTISLVAELMGTASNFFLIDHQGILLGSLFPPPAAVPYRSAFPIFLPRSIRPVCLRKRKSLRLSRALSNSTGRWRPITAPCRKRRPRRRKRNGCWP